MEGRKIFSHLNNKYILSSVIIFAILFIFIIVVFRIIFPDNPSPKHINKPYFNSPSPNNFAENENGGIKYASKEILAVTGEKTSLTKIKATINETLTKHFGSYDKADVAIDIIGYNKELGIYQLKILKELEKYTSEIMNILEKNEIFKTTLPNYKQSLSGSTSDSITPPVTQWKEKKGKKYWAQKQINLPEAWTITTGDKNLKIGVIDYAFDTGHNDLKRANYIAPKSEQEEISWNDLPRHYTDHGTGVASLIAASADNDEGMAGVMWEKDLTCYGTYYLTDIIEAILDAIQREIRIVNISMGPAWGRIGEEDKYCQKSHHRLETLWQNVIEYAQKNKLLIVYAAGNNANLRASKIPPASLAKDYSNLISVGAFNTELEGIYTSGESITVSAPGRNIWTAQTSYGALDYIRSPYEYKSGTSYSAPLVSGTAGLMLSLDPGLTPDEIKTIITDTAKMPKTNNKKEKIPGEGILNTYKALEKTKLLIEDKIELNDK